MQKICPSCGHRNPSFVLRCRKCGQRFGKGVIGEILFWLAAALAASVGGFIFATGKNPAPIVTTKVKGVYTTASGAISTGAGFIEEASAKTAGFFKHIKKSGVAAQPAQQDKTDEVAASTPTAAVSLPPAAPLEKTAVLFRKNIVDRNAKPEPIPDRKPVAALPQPVKPAPAREQPKPAVQVKETRPAPAVKETQPPSSDGMAYIQSGHFYMGSSSRMSEGDERPVRKIYLDAFYIDKHEVSVAEYKKCVAAGVCAEPASSCKWGKHDGRLPMTCVIWKEADTYCRWAGKRLPTEAEWEKAVKAGGRADYFFGDDDRQLGAYAWYDRNSSDELHAVATKKANPNGLFDVYGNAWEWVADWYDDSYDNLASRNPKGPARGEFKSIRGGSSLNLSDACRSSNRAKQEPSARKSLQGFRCARSAN